MSCVTSLRATGARCTLSSSLLLSWLCQIEPGRNPDRRALSHLRYNTTWNDHCFTKTNLSLQMVQAIQVLRFHLLELEKVSIHYLYTIQSGFISS